MAWVNLTEEEAGLIIAGMTLLTVPLARKISEDLTNAFKPEPEEEATANRFRSAAMANYHDEGELEFDEGAVVAMGDDAGAYVMAWQWITNAEAGLPEPEEEEADA